MRNILLALLLANILFFLYEKFVEAPPVAGVAVVTESELGPPLEDAVAEAGDSNASVVGDDGDAGDVSIDDEPTAAARPIELAAVVGRSCVSVGPFRAAADADAALSEFTADGMPSATRAQEGEVFIGHWVQIRNVPDRQTGNEMIETLQEGGLGDAYLVESEAEGLKISLGLFGEMPRAERIELQAKSLGLPADISPRTRTAMVYFVDIGLPPGRGAGAIVGKYGEDKVLLRGEATCPQIR